jgi:hypothetical protein
MPKNQPVCASEAFTMSWRLIDGRFVMVSDQIDNNGVSISICFLPNFLARFRASTTLYSTQVLPSTFCSPNFYINYLQWPLRKQPTPNCETLAILSRLLSPLSQLLYWQWPKVSFSTLRTICSDILIFFPIIKSLRNWESKFLPVCLPFVVSIHYVN